MQARLHQLYDEFVEPIGHVAAGRLQSLRRAATSGRAETPLVVPLPTGPTYRNVFQGPVGNVARRDNTAITQSATLSGARPDRLPTRRIAAAEAVELPIRVAERQPGVVLDRCCPEPPARPRRS